MWPPASILLTCTPAPDVPRAVIPSGVDTKRFRPRDEAGTAKRLRILFVGRLEPQKGLAALTSISAGLLSAHPDVEIWVAGNDTPSAPGGHTWREHWKACLGTEALARCRFLSHVAWAEMPGVYRQCDVLVLPSVRDNLPNVALEAMACGLSVVASDTAGMGPVIQHGRSGLLLSTKNIDTWIAALAGLAANRRRLASLGRSARDTIAAQYDLRAMSEQVLDLCARACRRSVPRHTVLQAAGSAPGGGAP